MMRNRSPGRGVQRRPASRSSRARAGLIMTPVCPGGGPIGSAADTEKVRTWRSVVAVDPEPTGAYAGPSPSVGSSPPPWAESAADVAAALGTDPENGLSEEEAARRLAEHGPNELRSVPPVPLWRKILAQFQDPLIYLLLGAVVISVAAWVVEGA